MRGRKPVPRHLKILRGNPGKRTANQQEPLPIGDLVDPPEWMTASQKAGWNYAIENAPRGLLKKLDRSVLVAWVVAEDLHRQATAMVARFGMLTKAPNTKNHCCPAIAFEPTSNWCVFNRIDAVTAFVDMDFR